MHIPVLLHEVIEGLSLTKGDTVVDATVGGGGYTKALCHVIGDRGTIYGFDEDTDALIRGESLCDGEECVFVPIEENFRAMKETLTKRGVTEIDGVAFDLGLSSFQIEGSGRGFSFLRDEPLLMTFGKDPKTHPFTAADIVNTWEERSIADVIFGYGEERYARQIASAIVEARKKKTIETTTQLADIVKGATPGRYANGPIHPATRTFQALRIAVNDELGALKDGLLGAYELLKPGKRMAVVSFHSLEDRIVKNFFKDRSAEGATIITKKPMTPTRDEIRTNPRSRSAKLRILEK